MSKKRTILSIIIILSLFFTSLKSISQTTGYLRFDTVRIYKQGGTCELYLINSTKDSLGLLTNIGGGLTRFIKPRKLTDSTIVIGLDTISLAGNKQLFDLTATRIAFGGPDNEITDDADLTYISGTNRFNTGTGNFADSIMVGFPRTVDLTYNQPLLTYDFSAGGSITNISGNSYIKNQYSAQQFARAWFDSARLGNLILSSRLGGGLPSLYSPNTIWYLSSSVRHIFAGVDPNEYAMIMFTTVNNNQSHRFSGVIQGFNFSNVGASNKPLVIATSGFSNARAGDIVLSTGRGSTGDTLTDFKMNVDYNVILDPSGNGEVQMTRVTNFQSGWKANDSVSSSTTITITTARAMWIFTGSSTATWTLPALSGNTDVTFFIKNKGSADIVLTAGTNEIYSSSATTTFNIGAGQGYTVHNDGTNWTIMNN